MARPTMSELIHRVRRLIFDLSIGDQVFSDDDIQEILDRHQTIVRYAVLRAAPTYLPNGTIEYRDYYADVGDWESDESLYDSLDTMLAPSTANRLTGHWTFGPPGQNPPVFIVGKTYDVWGAAADLLDLWAAKIKLEYDFSADNQSFQRSQRVETLRRLANEYRHKRPVLTIPIVRTDTSHDYKSRT